MLILIIPTLLYGTSLLWFRFLPDGSGGPVAMLLSGVVALGCAVTMHVMGFKELQARRLRASFGPFWLCLGLSVLAWPFAEWLLVFLAVNLMGPISFAEGGMQAGGAFGLALVAAFPLATLLASYAGLMLARSMASRG
jgi:hypothetical protein